MINLDALFDAMIFGAAITAAGIFGAVLDAISYEIKHHKTEKEERK